MSYILDALKKSDQQRKQGDVPDLQTVHLAINAEEKQPILLFAVIALLLLLLMFVLGYLLSSQLLTDDTVQLTPQPMQQQTPTEPSVPLEKRQPVVAAPPENSEPVEPSTQKASSEQVTQPALSEAAPVRSLEPAVVEAVPGDLMNIPYLHELPEYQQQSIPAMNFAGHVYSSVASSRSVIINGVTMSEGESLMPGLSVEFITLNGVVFRYQEILFRVDILQDWSIE